MSIQVTIHSTGEGTCSLSGKQCSGLTVTIGDFKEVFLSQNSFVRLVNMNLPKRPVKTTANAQTPNGVAT